MSKTSKKYGYYRDFTPMKFSRHTDRGISYRWAKTPNGLVIPTLAEVHFIKGVIGMGIHVSRTGERERYSVYGGNTWKRRRDSRGRRPWQGWLKPGIKYDLPENVVLTDIQGGWAILLFSLKHGGWAGYREGFHTRNQEFLKEWGIISAKLQEEQFERSTSKLILSAKKLDQTAEAIREFDSPTADLYYERSLELLKIEMEEEG